MQKKAHISFLIVTYKSAAALATCLMEVRRVARDCVYEIIIGTNDQKECFVEGSDIRIVHNQSNIGFGAAHNILARHATGKYLFIINPDTFSFSDNVCAIREVLHDTTIGIVAPALHTALGEEEIWSYGAPVTPWRIIANNIKPFPPMCRETPLCDVGWVSGAFFVISRSLFLALEGFDEDFFLYYEDVDLCRRVHAAGYRVVRATDFSVRHIGGTQTQDHTTQKRMYDSSQDRYLKKHYGTVIAALFRLLRYLTHGR